MTDTVREHQSKNLKYLYLAPVLIFLILGLFSMHWPMLTTRLAQIQTDEGDTRLNMYALEHGYRWLAGYTHHEKFWSPPVYFPQAWTAACTETLIGTGIFYWPWRMAGIPAATSYQMWLISISVINFLTAFMWLRIGRRLPLHSCIPA